MKNNILLIILFVATSNFAQLTNKMLNRNFWKNKPSIENIDKLIKEGNSLTQKDKFSMDAICYAILEDSSFEILKHLINKGVNVNEPTHDKRNYIFWASYRNNLEFMKFLVKKGSRTDMIDSAGYSLIQFTAAVGNGNTKIYDFIIENGGNIKEIDKTGKNLALLYAPRMKNINFLDYLKNKGVNLYKKDNKGNDLFIYASQTKNKTILEQLVKKGFNYKTINKANENAFIYNTALMHRSKAKVNIETINYLEKLGLNPKIITKDKNTALHNVAKSSKKPEIINYFIKKGLNVNLKNKQGNTPFINAAYNNSEEILSVLLKKTKNINEKNNNGASALTMAVEKNTPEIVSYLIKNGANVAVIDAKKRNLYYHLIDKYREKNIDIFNQKLKILKSNGLKLNDNDLLAFAIKKQKIKIIEALLKNGLNINKIGKNGLAPIHIAVMTAKNINFIKKMLQLGGIATIKTKANESVYDLALANEILSKNKKEISFLK